MFYFIKLIIVLSGVFVIKSQKPHYGIGLKNGQAREFPLSRSIGQTELATAVKLIERRRLLPVRSGAASFTKVDETGRTVYGAGTAG